jgi:hypothetical protein
VAIFVAFPSVAVSRGDDSSNWATVFHPVRVDVEDPCRVFEIEAATLEIPHRPHVIPRILSHTIYRGIYGLSAGAIATLEAR